MSGSSDGRGIFNLRALPANLQAEQSLLGSLFMNNRVLDRCDGLEPEHFADAIHRRLYADARALITDGNVVDLVTIKNRYEHAGILDDVGGTAYLAKLQSAMIDYTTVKSYAIEIRDCWIRREAIELGQRLAEGAFGADPAITSAALLDEVSASLARLASTGSPARMEWMDMAMDAALASMERAQAGATAGLSTGFAGFDARLGGLEPGLVYVIAGRPGMGKSAVASQVAINVARAGKRVHILSLEMSASQIGRRTLATAAGVPIQAMKGGQIDSHDASAIVRARRELSGMKLTIDDTAGQTPGQIIRKCRAIKRSKTGLDLIMLDHLNLVKAEDVDARHGGTWATERASGAMLELAKDCDVPILLLAQLNRGVEGREDKRPGLGDLRQAGAIEQDASAVGFVYRPEYYLGGEPERKTGEDDYKADIRQREWQQQKDALRGKAEMIWAKVRDGEPGTDPLLFDGPTATFREPRQ